MLIFHETQHFSDFVKNTRPQVSRMKRFKVVTYLTINRRDVAVVMSPKLFQHMEKQLLKLELANQLYEMDLEEFRISKLSADDFRKQIRPNPRALGMPAEEAFAKLRKKSKRRHPRLKEQKSIVMSSR